ncbi:MAG: DUF6544 family protein [Candidatus Promineifilaceae bacterium]
MLRVLLYVALGLIILVPILFYVGLHVEPRPFAPFSQQTPDLETMPLPDGLPAPVERYYRAAIGETIPIINSAVISTRGTLRFAGITFPTRFRFTHEAGQGYRHYAEVTLFGQPLMKINERYLDGAARMELPVGVIENEPKIDMAANLGLWAESIWLPSIYLTDSRVHWEAIDDTTARLVVPFEDSEDSFTVYFDPQTGLIDHLETLRYRDAEDAEKIVWINEVLGWAPFHGLQLPSPAAAIWADEGTPWLFLSLDEVVYNADVSDYIRAKGP